MSGDVWQQLEQHAKAARKRGTRPDPAGLLRP